MNKDLLVKLIKAYTTRHKEEADTYADELRRREERAEYYRSWTRDRLINMEQEDLYTMMP